jgi:hypothetical protein
MGENKHPAGIDDHRSSRLAEIGPKYPDVGGQNIQFNHPAMSIRLMLGSNA